MALAYTSFVSQVITKAAPSHNAESTSVEKDLGANTLVQGLWLYTTIAANGLSGSPNAGGRIVVNLYPRGATVSGSNHSDDVIHSFAHAVTKDGAYSFADYCPGTMPRFIAVGVKNLTGKQVATTGLNLSIECIKTTG